MVTDTIHLSDSDPVIEAEEKAFWTFKPRPNRPELFDEQSAFVDAMDEGVSFFVGGNGCLAGEQVIFDPVARQYRRIDSIREPFHVWSLNHLTGIELSLSSPPFVKGVDHLWRVSLSNGLFFVATPRHRVCCVDGEWRRVSQLRVGDALLAESTHAASRQQIHDGEAGRKLFLDAYRATRQFVDTSTYPANATDRLCQFVFPTIPHVGVQFQQSLGQLCDASRSSFWQYESHSFRTPSNSSGRYCQGLRLRGERPRSRLNTDLEIALRQDDVFSHILISLHADGWDISRANSHHHRSSCRHSRNHFYFQEPLFSASKIRVFSQPYSQFFDLVDILGQGALSNMAASRLTPACPQFHAESSNLSRTTASFAQEATGTRVSYRSCEDPYGGNGLIATYITSIEYVRKDVFYDIHIPGNNNYLCAGTWHHNSGTSAAAACKLSRFVFYRQPPPRWDTPFWVVGPDYDQTIESFFKEKLYGMGFIPDCEIDWDRVTWHDKRRFLPKTIPLLPWVNGDPAKSWTIEFRSFEQGRIAMQAREIGGFCLTEQFPWSILVEILRGMRAHDAPGSKFCEFTPVDPMLSRPLQEMMEEDTLPPGWRVYRANTLCNVQDPNSVVDQKWYDEFFGMVGDEMRETRQTGAWATFEGLIYKSFNTNVHLFPNDRLGEVPFSPDAIHKRTIDWGTGPHNAFVVLSMAIDSQGRIYVYDEYYTTEPNTHEERIREVHRKDGWRLQVEDEGPPTSYKLVPAEALVRPRWRYDQSQFQQTYGPPDDPGMFRECAKYMLPVSRMSLGPNSYHPSIEAMQAMLRYTPEEYAAGTHPKLFISRKCKNLIRELSQLRWQVPPTRAVNPKDAKAYEVEKSNHAPSALRGGIWSHLQGSAGGISGHMVEQRSRPQVRHRR